MRRFLVVFLLVLAIAGGTSGHYIDLGPDAPELSDELVLSDGEPPLVTVVQRFEATGQTQYLALPADVDVIDAVACGAAGGDYHGPSGVGEGGHGAQVTSHIAVDPRRLVVVQVGSVGTDEAGGWNGGGSAGTGRGVTGVGGGGATDLRTGGDQLKNRILVAGGGGGGGWVRAGEFVNEALVGGSGGAVGGANPFDAWTEPVGGGGATAEGGGRGTMVAANGQRGTGGDGAIFGGSGGGGGLYGGGGSGRVVVGFVITGAGGGGSSVGDVVTDGACAGDGWVEVSYVSSEPITIRPHGVVVTNEGDSGSTMWSMPVLLTRPADVLVTADWSTRSAVGSGHAAPGRDYAIATGSVSWQPGETTAFIEVQVMADELDEKPLYGGEWGIVEFHDPVNAVIDEDTFFGLGLFSIVDDD